MHTSLIVHITQRCITFFSIFRLTINLQICLSVSTFVFLCITNHVYVFTCVCVIIRKKSVADVRWGLLVQTPCEQSEGLKSVSCLIFIGHTVIATAAQTGIAAVLHDGQMDWKIKNMRAEWADTLPDLFQDLKVYSLPHTYTLRMLCFLTSATSALDIFALALCLFWIPFTSV